MLIAIKLRVCSARREDGDLEFFETAPPAALYV